MYAVYINLLYFLSIFWFTYNKNLFSPPKNYPVMSGLLHDELSKFILRRIVLISIVMQTCPYILVLKSSDQSGIIQILSYLIYYVMQLCIFRSKTSMTI